MSFMNGNGDFAVALCNALGENPDNVRGVVLRVYVGEVVTATIEKYVDKSNSDEVVEVIKTCEWKTSSREAIHAQREEPAERHGKR